ncbi:MAG: hypothetical protein KGQ49_00270 [Verrucomicrobia bacterium]|nr:hypothetical protein [Verrucomicrobiota bacterium]MBU6445814.1 hypothetical protein [Verrucomicrobiota bacterium]MDE3048033.1 hypothetical protein [Verrucomicrobiota bacterium]
MVRSFDLFDTLLGRLRYFPHSTYEMVEKQFPMPGFAFYRMAAEKKSDGTLAGIYRHLRQMLDLTRVQAKALMDFEFRSDVSQLFPIPETLAQVQDGDLIVSDTFYSLSQIKQILKKIGLQKRVHIYATPRGKYLGTIWDTVKKQHPVASHLGNFLHSDVHMAEKNGVRGVHFSDSELNPTEKAMLDFGQGDLGCLMRAVRLQNPYPVGSPEFLLWNEQCALNVPLLIHASLHLHAFCQKKKKRRVLFTSRDGCLWIQVFRTLFPEYESLYFQTSRFTYLFPTQTFIDYVRSIYSEDAMIVDLNGSGRSCRMFFKAHMKVPPLYYSIVNHKKRHFCILRKSFAHDGMEKMNYDLVGALYDVRGGQPMRSSLEYDLRYIRPSHACIAKCVELLPFYHFDTFNAQIVDWAVSAMESRLELDNHIVHAKVHAHFEGAQCFHMLASGLLVQTLS